MRASPTPATTPSRHGPPHHPTAPGENRDQQDEEHRAHRAGHDQQDHQEDQPEQEDCARPAVQCQKHDDGSRTAGAGWPAQEVATRPGPVNLPAVTACPDRSRLTTKPRNRAGPP